MPLHHIDTEKNKNILYKELKDFRKIIFRVVKIIQNLMSTIFE